MTDHTTTATPDVLLTNRPRGRPSLYTEQLGEDICDRIADGRSLRAICAEPGMPDKATVMRWLNRHEEFRDRYRRARRLQMDLLADQIVEIADSVEHATDRLEIAKAKLRIDARKWLITHLAAKKFGTEEDGNPIQIVYTEAERALL